MAAMTDDLPWPDLDNVSRGGTRGNQGQKGVLGPADNEGRCIIQLRVQPHVLSVRLNRQASAWYRTLEGEVTHAQNLTKTFWRKARRRQEYDARADQDHMELHEWLQQLKDKTMSHLEILMEKGSIKGPPYAMPDDMELTFLRKFVQRQAAGIPHNPRLRNSDAFPIPQHSAESLAPMPFVEQEIQDPMDPNNTHIPPYSPAGSHTAESEAANSAFMTANAAFAAAQRQTQDALMRYKDCLDAEYQARAAVDAAKKRRDDIMYAVTRSSQAVVEMNQDSAAASARTFREHAATHADDQMNDIDRTLVEDKEMDDDTVAAARVIGTFHEWAHEDGPANEIQQLTVVRGGVRRTRRTLEHSDEEEDEMRRGPRMRSALHELNIGGGQITANAGAFYHQVHRKDPSHWEGGEFAYLQETPSEPSDDVDAEAETDSDEVEVLAKFQHHAQVHVTTSGRFEQVEIRSELRKKRRLLDDSDEDEMRARALY